MPTYEYETRDPAAGCAYCQAGFECVQHLSEPPLTVCPRCGVAVRKRLCAPAIGRSVASLDSRAKAAGFTKLKRLGKGEYEKQY
jgi:putative FmdB family regulatory protein